MNIADLTITSLETITGFDLVTGNYRFTLDELQNASIANSQEKTEVTGKGGRKLTTLKRNKAVVVSGTNGLLSGGLLEVQTGGTFKNEATTVLWTDYLVVSGGKATTTYKAVGTKGAEIKELHVRNSDGTLGQAFVQNSTASATGQFAYADATKQLSFHTDVTEGTEIVVVYDRKITANVLTNESDVYSEKCTLYIDALAEDRCGKVYRVQFFIPKADFSGEFSIELGDNQTVHAFEAESLTGACGMGAGNALWTYTVFGADTEDAA